MKRTTKYIVELPVKIKLFDPAVQLLSVLSKDTQKEVKEKIIQSSSYITEHFINLPEGKLFEYYTQLETLFFGYVAFWDRKKGEECVVIASFGFCNKNDIENGYKEEMITNFRNCYFATQKMKNESE